MSLPSMLLYFFDKINLIANSLAVEYTTKLQRERDKMLEEEEMLRKEIQSLHSSIRYV
jgi:hypothetical protein